MLILFLQRIRNLVQKGIDDGLIKPLKRTVFDANQVEDAFRLLASGKHIGKIILKIQEPNYEPKLPMPMTIPRVYCQREFSNVIIGGLGGFGLELSNWLIGRGCRKLILSSRRGITSTYQSYRLR